MSRRSVFLALALAAGTSAAGLAQDTTRATSALAGAQERTLVTLGDTLWPMFFIPNADTLMLKPTKADAIGRRRAAVVVGCGVPRMFLRIYHPVPSLAIPGSFSALNPGNPAATRPTIWGPLSADTVYHQVMDTTATTGACTPAGSPGLCQLDGSTASDPLTFPAPDCNLSRNRFLATAALDSAIDRFIARTYPPKSP